MVSTMSHIDSEQKPEQTPVSWIQRLAYALLLLGAVWLYAPVFDWLFEKWRTNSDYSHGFLVPLFAAYLLWTTRAKLLQGRSRGPIVGVTLGCAMLACALLLRVAGIYLAIQTFEGLSIIPVVLGVATIAWGPAGLTWSLPGALFLIFMIPLPSFLAGQLSGLLQSIATLVSTFGLQTLGIPAAAEGNIITLSNGQIGVAEACSGLRMLYSFIALTVGACLIIDRVWIEKLLIGLSAIPIALVANAIRIIATGVAFEYFDPALAEHFFHDVAGWLMMPLGFLLLLGAVAILDRLILIDEQHHSFSQE